MNIKKYRYFGGFLNSQQNWLNRMAENGYRLVGTTKLMYEFEPCPKGEYQYCVEFVGQYSYKKAKDYRAFLEDMGYRTFTKNINLNYSIGKVRWRPWAQGAGQISTSPGSFNKELLIMEKKNDGKPFELHTDRNDLIDYYKPIRNAYLSNAILFLALPVLFRISGMMPGIGFLITFAALAMIFLIPAVFYSMQLHKLKKDSRVEE